MGFLLILQLMKLERKTEKKQDIFLHFLKVFQTHKKKSEKINLTWIYNEKVWTPTTGMKCLIMNVMSVEIRTPPSLGFWPSMVITIRSSHLVPCGSVGARAPECPTPGAPALALLGCSGR